MRAGSSILAGVEVACHLCAGQHTGIGAQRFETPEAAWEASWKEGQRLVKLYQADLQVLVLCHFSSLICTTM